MKYDYVPGSIAADARETAFTCCPRHAGRAAAPPRPVVLDVADVPLADASPIARAVVAAGGWARCVRALVEDAATCNLVESVSVRVRLNGQGGYAMWRDGRAAGAALYRPFRALSHEAFAVELGLLRIEYGNCDRWIPWLEPCGARDVRINADGTLRAHKTSQGVKCR